MEKKSKMGLFFIKIFKLVITLLLLSSILAGCGQILDRVAGNSDKFDTQTASTDTVAPSEVVAANTIILKIDATTMKVNGTSRTIPAPPVIREGRTLVPVRVVSEAMSASVYWLEKTKQIRIVEGGKEIILTIGSKEVTSGGMTKTMDVEPMIIGTSTYVPLRFISENLGAQIAWNDATREITITR